MVGWIVLPEILVRTIRVVNSDYSDLSLDDSTRPYYSLYMSTTGLGLF